MNSEPEKSTFALHRDETSVSFHFQVLPGLYVGNVRDSQDQVSRITRENLRNGKRNSSVSQSSVRTYSITARKVAKGPEHRDRSEF